ncbi:MAG TPA: peptidylprolyl isomerase [Kofleriaceae bacterium]|jgi:cyclophilin family peptidyl-prolyl cis-trans isomerase
MADPVVDVSTSLGTFTITLDPGRAPKSVENFLKYVDSKHYEGTVFHRVISNFMIQGGGYDEKLERKKTLDPVENESTNNVANTRGTVAMARTGDPHSATAQFFVNVVDNKSLDHKGGADGWGYSVFGTVTEGMDVVEKIKSVKTGPSGPFAKDAPQTPVVITSIKRR